MSVVFKFGKIAGIAALCLGTMISAYADSTQSHKRTKKQEALPPLPSGPTGRPVPQIPLDSISPVLPQVSYQNGMLTIVAPNSTLGDILRAVHKQTGAEIEIPAATDRVVTHLGPGPARDVMAELLNGSRFNYVLLGSPEDPSALTRVVLVAKTDTGAAAANAAPQRPMPQNMAPPPQETSQDMNDADQPEENADENNAEQQQPEPEQPAQQQGDQAVKTPQEMLQEMQQRQMQMQQQGQPGQQPGQPFPGRPPYPQQPPQQQQQ